MRLVNNVRAAQTIINARENIPHEPPVRQGALRPEEWKVRISRDRSRLDSMTASIEILRQRLILMRRERKKLETAKQRITGENSGLQEELKQVKTKRMVFLNRSQTLTTTQLNTHAAETQKIKRRAESATRKSGGRPQSAPELKGSVGEGPN